MALDVTLMPLASVGSSMSEVALRIEMLDSAEVFELTVLAYEFLRVIRESMDFNISLLEAVLLGRAREVLNEAVVSGR
jgi:hypothetical protein